MPAPGAPTLSILGAWNNIRLSWASVSGATGYRLRRKKSGASDSDLVLLADTEDLVYTDYPPALDYTSASNPTRTWVWDLVAYNDDGESTSSTQTFTMLDVTNSESNLLELLRPSYNDGSNKTASYSDITKSGSGGASDGSANEAVLYHDQRWTSSI